ncbi:MAG: glycoside hydrolase/phage tail family protein [Pseudomonadota bacterium]
MATIVLSAAGAAIGGSVGGTLAGLSAVAVGRAAGATLGKVIDQRIMGQGSDVRETGKVDRFRLTNAGEGAPVGQLYGRMRLGGQVIWASDFAETSTVTGGGKGAPSQPKTREYSYSVNLAIALCEGVITRVGRVWADGEEVAADSLNMRVYTGTRDQLPDPVIAAIEGAGQVPAYRGTAYVVMEALELAPFGNRVPQFTFEVVRPEQPDQTGADEEMTRAVRAVALMPGSGEYALATTPVYYSDGATGRWSANVNTPAGKTDFAQSLEILQDELPECEATSLVVSWFGGDLRCADCRVEPKVERADHEGSNMPWSVSGLTRAGAVEIAQSEDRPVYGGTPADVSVVEAIHAMNEAGKAVMFYPFLLMDQLDGNTLPDPYTGETGQPRLPWRGRITGSLAPGVDGSPDGTAAMEAEVAAFVGNVTAADFTVANGAVTYTGPDEWTFSRFILHYAALCAAAGGVDAFCIGSELRGLTQLRGAGHTFPFVAALRQIAADVRSLVGPDTKIGYAADWSEYFGYQPQDGTGNVYFHLDPLWADDEIDFIGIDNYMPLSDWRAGRDHLDAQSWDAIYDLGYLTSNIEGGEGYDWYYHSVDAEAAQIRTPITDGAHDEPWVFRYKDLRNWWLNTHHNRIDGLRDETPTAWEPQMKPFWFTELGCAAVDKGTNQPNKFLDEKSSESSLPKHSNGARDDLIQKQYLRAMHSYWTEPENNPVSIAYGGPMLDMGRAFVWAWDTRPYPFFPNNLSIWSDGRNYPRGHWINGRTSGRTLANVVSEICERADLTAYNTQGLYGYVRGFAISDVADARSALQPLMLRYAFDAIERNGELVFRMRDGVTDSAVDRTRVARTDDLDGALEQVRDADVELAGRVRLGFVEADANFETATEEAILADDATHAVSATELALSLTRAEARQITERWLAEARIAREGVRLALPPSRLDLGAGDVVQLPGDDGEGPARFRIDRVEQGPFQVIDAVRIEPETYVPSEIDADLATVREFVPPVPVQPLFLDLPLLTGDEAPHAPHLAVTGQPWPGSVAVYSAAQDDGYALNSIIAARSTVGLTQSALAAAPAGIWDRGASLEVKLVAGTLSSIERTALLNGGNLAAIGDGSSGNWELFQFQDAELIGENTYLLSNRLRGQLGTDALMPDAWPVGSWFVLLDGVPGQIALPASLRRVAQNYRIGPAQRAFDDPSYTRIVAAFDGNGLRPYAPAHLRRVVSGGDHAFAWTRRTRIDGDPWESADVPLGEDVEAYRVQVLDGGTVLREAQVTTPEWTYSAAMQAADGVPDYRLEVAQISSRYGPGLPARFSA